MSVFYIGADLQKAYDDYKARGEQNQESDSIKSGGEIMEKRETEHGSGLLLDGYKITSVHINNGGSHHIYGKDQAHTIYSDNFSGVVIMNNDSNCMDLIPMTSIERIEFASVEEEVPNETD